MAFRCDGDDRVGAGHVARCLQIALAFRMGGDEPLFVGSFDGLAAAMLSKEGMPMSEPLPGRALGLPEETDLAIVDSYELEPAETAVPLADIVDAPRESEALTIDYHPGARGTTLAGPAYAPLAPGLTNARRERGFGRALVTAGGSRAGQQLAQRAVAACAELGLEAERAQAVGLAGAIERADVAVSAAGVTAYELACAGVPAALVPIAPNQERVAEAFAAGGLALAGEDPGPLLAALADASTRGPLAAAGPATLDGYGAFRVRDGLRAVVRGDPAPPVLRYRPATAADSDLLLAWRNDPVTRAASRQSAEIAPEEHERWLAGVLPDADRRLLVVEDPDGAAGSLRFDVEPDEAEISVALAPDRRGRGLGPRAVREASELTLAALPGLERVRAEVLPGNDSSIAAFCKAGFTPTEREGSGGASVLVLERAALASPPA